MKLAMIIIGAVLLLGIAAALGGGYYMYRFAIVRDRSGKRQTDFWNAEFKASSSLPEEVTVQMKEGFYRLKAMPYEKVEIRSHDGLRLVGRVFEHPEPRGVFLMVHGYRSSGAWDFSCALESIYTRDHFTCLVIDHRGHGESEGEHICFGALEKYDVVQWAKYAQKRWEKLPVVMDGVSMGAATVMMGCEVGYPENVKAIIADCGYTTPAAICKKVLKQWFGLPPFPIYHAANFFARLLGGFDLEKSSALLAMLNDGRKLPVLIAHGKADGFVPYEMSVENMTAFVEDGRGELFTSEEADHGLAFLYDYEGYHNAMLRLFDRAGISMEG